MNNPVREALTTPTIELPRELPSQLVVERVMQVVRTIRVNRPVTVDDLVLALRPRTSRLRENGLTVAQIEGALPLVFESLTGTRNERLVREVITRLS